MNKTKKLLLILIFNFGLMLAELIGGVLSNSLALIADAGHMLTDSLAILLSYFAIIISQKPPNDKKTFGYYRAEIIVSLINGLSLLLISGYIFYEAVSRFLNPLKIKVDILLTIGIIGFIGNLIGVILLKNESKENLNIRGAFLHLLSDTMSSLGVIVGGIIVYYTKFYILDSMIGILIAGIVLRGAIGLILESGEILLESTPKDVSLDKLQSEVKKLTGVKDIHDIHVWTISLNKRALSAHILLNNISVRESQEIVFKVKDVLYKKFNISHTTLEVECIDCKDSICEYKNGSINIFILVWACFFCLQNLNIF